MIEKPIRKSRADGEQSRERLLLAAMKLFAEQGFARTSTREIALAAGANVAAISYYFGDKAGLYKAALTDFLPPPQKNIEMFDQPHFTLRQALEGYYAQLLGPLLEGEEAELCMRLWLREVLEPRGVWAEELNTGIRAEHMAFAGVLARHLGVPVDDEVHRLVFACASLGVQIMTGTDVITALTPQLLASPDALRAWIPKLAGYAEAIVLAEQEKRQKGAA